MIEHMFDTLDRTLPNSSNQDDDFDVSPVEGFEEMEAGEELAVRVFSIDPDSLSPEDRLVLLRAHQKMVSHFQARSYADISAVNHAYEEMKDGDLVEAHEGTALELRAALRLTRRGADILVNTAWELSHRLPGVCRSLLNGSIDLSRVRVICSETAHLPENTARRVTDEILGDAHRFTTGQLRHKLKKLCIDADPQEAETRYNQAVEDRRVVVDPTDSGTAELLLLNVAPHLAEEAFGHIDHLARQLRTDGETRTIDQLRTDVALDLLTGNTSSNRTGRGTVTLHADLTTLTELSEHPGELAGFGPVIADIARQITEQQHDSEWRYLVTDPHSGEPVYGGITRRRPTAGLRRAIETIHPTCVFPGCRMPSTQSDIDHTNPWAETNTTDPRDLAPNCRWDHTGRHKHGWTYRRTPHSDHIWTSPLGIKYTTSGRAPPPD